MAVYAVSMIGSMAVVVAMALSSPCVARDKSRIPYLQVESMLLEYVSERIAAMKMCDDLRSGLPMLLLLFYLGVLCLFLETQLLWQKELDIPPSVGILEQVQTWSALLLLAVSAVGLFMVIVYDHTGVHRHMHGVGVLMMLLGLVGVYICTAVYESTCNLRMHAQRHKLTSENMLGIAHVTAVALFALTIALFVVAWSFDHLPLAVLSEYVLFVIIFVLAVICMVELAALQHAAAYKAERPVL